MSDLPPQTQALLDMYDEEIARILAVLLEVPVGDRLNVLALATRAALDSGMLELSWLKARQRSVG